MCLWYTKNSKECCVGFFGFFYNLFNSSRERTSSNITESNNSSEEYQDMDDLDFDEMNDVWDELDG